MIDEAPLSSSEIEQLFIRVPDPEPNTFELALALGGTVAAGAYTAGAIDYLIEALDEWTSLRESGDPRAPRHKVALKVITGTSGGGVNAAIAARAFAYDFPHARKATAFPANNPFYEIWINRLTLDAFLDTSDVDQGNFVSLLNGGPIDNGATYIRRFSTINQRQRSYLGDPPRGDPLRLTLTLTNLRGVPYKTVFGDGSLSETFVDHADYCRFALVYPGCSLARPRPDELTLDFVSTTQQADWLTFSNFARATAAFPLGFPPLELSKPTAHYRYRVVVVPPASSASTPEIVGRLPDWGALREPATGAVPDNYSFLSVDGGATDNEPIELARTALAGLAGRNPRDGDKANRAVLLIDPFAGKATLGPAGLVPFIDLPPALISTLTGQTRYDSQDLLLAARQDVFSRFMLTPRRGDKIGGEAIASNGLGAFLGFACPAFMRHDFLLGRANCQDFLRRIFVLPETNRIFDGMWTPDQKQDHRVLDGGVPSLPIIPVLGSAAESEAIDDWPKGAYDPETHRAAIEKRFKAIARLEGGASTSGKFISWLIAQFGSQRVGDFAVNAIKNALSTSGLL